MNNNIELLKKYIINKEFDKAQLIIDNPEFDLYLYNNIRILFVLSVNNHFHNFFEQYLKYVKNKKEFNYLISYSLSRSIESNNLYAFNKLIEISNLSNEQITTQILTLSGFLYDQIYINMLEILFSKYPSFKLTSLVPLSISINAKNYQFYNSILKHMENINAIDSEWINENINNEEDKKNIKKIIKINKF